VYVLTFGHFASLFVPSRLLLPIFSLQKHNIMTIPKYNLLQYVGRHSRSYWSITPKCKISVHSS